MKFSKRSTIIVSMTVVLLVAAGGVYYLVQQLNKKDQPVTSNTNAPEKPAPSTVAADPLKYADKTMEITGLVRQVPSGQYILMQEKPEADKPAGITVDFATNKIDSSGYLNGDKPVILTGKLVKTETADSLTVIFVVSAVKP